MLFSDDLYLICAGKRKISSMFAKHFLLNQVFAAMCLLAGTLPANSAVGALYELDYPPSALAAHHALDSRVNFSLNAGTLSQLVVGEHIYLPLPDQSVIRASVARLNVPMGGTTKRHTVLSVEGGRGSIEFSYTDTGIERVRINDLRTPIRVYEAVLDVNGMGELVEQDARHYYCINMPAENTPLSLIAPDQPVFFASVPDLSQLQVLQSKPNANKVLYLNYWGGVLSDTAWNDEYNNTEDISYTAYSSDGDSASFSTTDLSMMWKAWRETVEDYAPFDVNVTTDQSVYDAMASEDRSMIIATTSWAWFGEKVGGVANFDSFGNDYSGIGGAWNKSLDAFGQTMSHEAGHQMGLQHDGKLGFVEYYLGHGANAEWGPIMGAPYGKTYVQWSKGEYQSANNPEDDLEIIKAKLGDDDDVIGNTQGTAYEISSSAYIEGVIEPRGLLAGMDTDVYRFNLTSLQDAEVHISPVLGDYTQRYGSNLSLYARLTDGTNDYADSSQVSPFHAQNNVLSFNGPLEAGTYYLIITALSPNPDWSSGFGEYANAGIYSVSLASSVNEPDLVSGLNVEDTDVYVGQLVHFSAQVKNIGSSGAPAGTLRFYRSDDEVISAADTQIAIVNTLALNALQTDFIAEQFAAPDMPGTVYYGVCVDAVPGENSVSNNCSAALEFTVRDFLEDLDIGDAVEQASLSWFRGGDESFFRQTDVSMNAGDAAQSGVIAGDEVSFISTDISGPGWLRFNWKVSSEDTFDYFRFMDNGLEIDAISGELGWLPVVYELAPGLHRLQWRYDKDPFTEEGLDAAWLDKVDFAEQKFEITLFQGPQTEGDSGPLEYSFTVSSNGVAAAATRVDYVVAGAGPHPADADDFGGVFPGGTIEFAAGETEKFVTIDVSGDSVLEGDETYSFTLSNPQGGVLGVSMSVQTSILDDDDDDADGVADTADNCPDDANPGQENTDGDFWGDACDTDDDNDGVDDEYDNCPLDINPDQEDLCTLCFPVKTSSASIAIICL